MNSNENRCFVDIINISAILYISHLQNSGSYLCDIQVYNTWNDVPFGSLTYFNQSKTKTPDTSRKLDLPRGMADHVSSMTFFLLKQEFYIIPKSSTNRY